MLGDHAHTAGHGGTKFRSWRKITVHNVILKEKSRPKRVYWNHDCLRDCGRSHDSVDDCRPIDLPRFLFRAFRVYLLRQQGPNLTAQRRR